MNPNLKITFYYIYQRSGWWRTSPIDKDKRNGLGRSYLPGFQFARHQLTLFPFLISYHHNHHRHVHQNIKRANGCRDYARPTMITALQPIHFCTIGDEWVIVGGDWDRGCWLWVWVNDYVLSLFLVSTRTVLSTTRLQQSYFGRHRE